MDNSIMPAEAGAPLPRLVGSICVALIIAYVVFLAGSYIEGHWLLARDGSGVPTDFVEVWSGGRMALAGHAAAAYDWSIHKLAEVRALGHSFDGNFSWQYPPTFFFAAVALALLPYTIAYLVWIGVTFLAFLAAIRAIIGDRTAYLVAAAFPAVVANFFVGQNGLLSASLIGGALAILDRRPILAGALIGLLSYKPHLGLLIPIALAAGGYWRPFISAGVVAILLALASWFAFGGESWAIFVPSIGRASDAFLSAGLADWSKLQTAFGLVRTLGGSEMLAWTVQIVVALIAAGAVALVWSSGTAYEIKAAALATGALLATPYLYTYDLAVLAVPVAFLLRLGRTRGFLPYELPAMGAAYLLILVFIVPHMQSQVGFGAVLIVAGLIALRVVAGRTLDSAAPHTPAASRS